MLEKSEWMKKLKMNVDLYCSPACVDAIVNNLDAFMIQLDPQGRIHARKKILKEDFQFPNLLLMRLAMIDFECHPPKVLGILIRDAIYQFFVSDEADRDSFIQCLLEILLILKDLYLFIFSESESRFIAFVKRQIIERKGLKESFSFAKKVSEVAFLDELKFINIQQYHFESLSAGLFSLNEEILPDPVLRISDNVDLLFDMHYFDIILEHNENCLLSSLLILEKRYLKLNIMDIPSRANNLKDNRSS